ncbi:MAG: hypothetical protein GY797_28910, partial [Deltaproteobacteria bacterium]|nr:hypothetical protein [Deltaproteobacteria bacterium]
MTKKEYADRNIGMVFDFIKQIIDHPDIINSMPANAELDFIDKDVPVRVKDVVVQYESKIKDKWYPIVRYDCS